MRHGRGKGSRTAWHGCPSPRAALSSDRSGDPNRTGRMAGDLRHLIEGVLLAIAALRPIVNPFGGAPVFLALTADSTYDLVAALAEKIAVNAFVRLLASRAACAGQNRDGRADPPLRIHPAAHQRADLLDRGCHIDRNTSRDRNALPAMGIDARPAQLGSRHRNRLPSWACPEHS